MRMRSKIQAAFDQIRAEDALKERTKAFVHAKTQGRRQDRARRRAFALAMACLTVLLLGGGGYLSYAMPVAAIGVDVNPSIELAVNIFDRVVGVTGYNEDGVRLAEELGVQNMRYLDAIEVVLSSQPVASCLQRGMTLELTVACASQEKAQAMQSLIADNTGIPSQQIYCCNQEEAQQAHEAGLSLGKYRVFLLLQEVDPDVDVQAVQGLTMRELRELLEEAEGSETSCAQQNQEHCQQEGQQGQAQHNGQGQGQGQGQGKGQGQGMGGKGA